MAMPFMLGTSRLTTPPSPADHVRGPRNAPLILVEYGDYECPYCRQAHLMMPALERRFAGELAYVFRHFPVTTIHPQAEEAAEAAEAAGARGEFWRMHDLLFGNQDALGFENLIGYAKSLGIDSNEFANELMERVHAKRVRDDFISGVRSGVNGTPTFFVNGMRFDGVLELETMTQALEYARR